MDIDHLRIFWASPPPMHSVSAQLSPCALTSPEVASGTQGWVELLPDTSPDQVRPCTGTGPCHITYRLPPRASGEATSVLAFRVEVPVHAPGRKRSSGLLLDGHVRTQGVDKGASTDTYVDDEGLEGDIGSGPSELDAQGGVSIYEILIWADLAPSNF